MYLGLSKPLASFGKTRIGVGLRITKSNFWYMWFAAMLYYTFAACFWMIYAVFYACFVLPFKLISGKKKKADKPSRTVQYAPAASPIKKATQQEPVSEEARTAELRANNCLRILRESDKILSSTKDPDVFFSRYKIVEEQVEELKKLQASGVSLTGSLTDAAAEVQSVKQTAIQNFIDRYWCATMDSAAKVKTTDAKVRKVQAFYDALEKYKEQMSTENVLFYTEKYQNCEF